VCLWHRRAELGRDERAERACHVKPIIVTLPLRTTNPQNGAQGMSCAAALHRAKVRREQRAVTQMALHGRISRVEVRALAAKLAVTLTRESAGVLDTDGLQAALKSVRDGVADALGIDDGDTERLEFRYQQRKCPKGRYAVECRIEMAT